MTPSHKQYDNMQLPQNIGYSLHFLSLINQPITSTSCFGTLNTAIITSILCKHIITLLRIWLDELYVRSKSSFDFLVWFECDWLCEEIYIIYTHETRYISHSSVVVVFFQTRNGHWYFKRYVYFEEIHKVDYIVQL